MCYILGFICLKAKKETFIKQIQSKHKTARPQTTFSKPHSQDCFFYLIFPLPVSPEVQPVFWKVKEEEERAEEEEERAEEEEERAEEEEERAEEEQERAEEEQERAEEEEERAEAI